MLSRHGSRYPTLNSSVEYFGDRLAAAAGKFKAKGPLAFLNDWKYQLGAEILVPKGQQTRGPFVFDVGVGKLSNNIRYRKARAVRLGCITFVRVLPTVQPEQQDHCADNGMCTHFRALFCRDSPYR